MNIGLDFDNTIALYDTLFREVAFEEGFISESWSSGGKTEIRDYLKHQLDGETTWMKLQGLVYGKYMHRAEMMAGVANFLLSCRVRNCKVFIVSHKTEYGHFDPEKISLRLKALKWMESKQFFDPYSFALERNDVFFADTRKKKIEKISQLKCDWFIDDLLEVFEEVNFPSDTKKILFGDFTGLKLSIEATAIDSWRKISKIVLGQIKDSDIISWTRRLIEQPIEKIEKIPGRGNSRVCKIIVSSDNSYALKYYPDQVSDRRPRLATEFGTLQLLHQNNISNVPKAIEKNNDLNLGLYEWIGGEPIGEPTLDDLDQAINFVEKLHTLSRNICIKNIDLASEACLSAKDLINQIEKRLLKLRTVSKSFPDLLAFLNRAFKPLWVEVRDESYSLWPFETIDSSLSISKQTLSPSDFGFHNCLRMNDETLTFIDFDYFGRDDPVKLTCDFIWHPAMSLNTEMIAKWKKTMLDIFASEPDFENRLNAAMPLYGLRWALIMLNEYLPVVVERREEAGEVTTYDPDKSRVIQLNKAKHYCEKVKVMISQVTVA